MKRPAAIALQDSLMIVLTIATIVLTGSPARAQQASLPPAPADSSGAAGNDFPMPLPYRVIEPRALETPFTFVRIRYSDVVQYPEGVQNQGAWLVDYPEADSTFSLKLGELTGIEVDPAGTILELTDPALPDYPFIYMVEGGRAHLSEDEAAALRAYLLGGGFLMVDDFWGENEWASLRMQLARVFPDREPIELWPDHEVFWSYYAITGKTPVPSIIALRSPRVTENPADAVIRGLIDDRGRLMAIFLHNMDLGDAWEHIDDPTYPKASSLGMALPLGINAVVYALTH